MNLQVESPEDKDELISTLTHQVLNLRRANQHTEELSAEFERLYTGALKREHALAVENRRVCQVLSNLLCRIHGDGGHYEAEHGTDKAVVDADIKVANDHARLSEYERQTVQSIAQPEREPEPIGYLDYAGILADFMSLELKKQHEARGSETSEHYKIPVYLAPVPRMKCKPLTEDALIAAYKSVSHDHLFVSAFITGVRYAESEHGIKETT